MKKLLVGLIAALLLGGVASFISAFTIPTYSYEEMFAQSDLVVIGRPFESRDTGERKIAEQVKPDVPIAGVMTDCQALYVLKGPKLKQFKLHHFRDVSPSDPNVVVVGGPVGISFDPSKNHRYLMFLVRENNDRFAPFAGQTMVEGISIQEINGTSFDE
jgi:hypothetical protein